MARAAVKKTTKPARAAATGPGRAAAPAGDPDPRFAPVADAFRGDRRVTFGRMMSAFGLKVDGKIFAMFPKGAFVAKLPKARVDAIVASGRGTHFDPGHGRLMKEWVSLTGHESTWVGLAREARKFVGGDFA